MAYPILNAICDQVSEYISGLINGIIKENVNDKYLLIITNLCKLQDNVNPDTEDKINKALNEYINQTFSYVQGIDKVNFKLTHSHETNGDIKIHISVY